MKPRVGLLVTLLLLAACASGQHRTARELNHRLQDRLGPDIATKRASLQTLQDGARVTLLGPLQSPAGSSTRDDGQRNALPNVVQGLLAPALMRIQVADSGPMSQYQREARVRDVRQYLVDYGLGQTLRPAAAAVAANRAETGLTITIEVQCRRRDNGPGHPKPACD